MPKAKSHLRRNPHTMYLVIVLGLILILLAVSSKYLMAKKTILSFNSLATHQAAENTAEQAKIIATTITTQPSSSTPLYLSSAKLEAYIVLLSQQLSKDIVVLDTKRTILADTFPGNVGKQYAEDANKAVDAAITEGKQGTFVETNTDYPKGIGQVVIPLTDIQSKTVGAVIMSLGHTQ